MIFPEALRSRQEFKRFAQDVPGLLLANMTEFGKTPLMFLREFQDMGYAAVLFPMTLFRVMMGRLQEAVRILKKTGTQKNLLPHMQSREDFYRMIRYDYGKK